MPNNSNEIPIRSEEVQEILTAIPGWMIRWGNTLVLFLIVGLLAISWFVKYPDVIIAEAMITTDLPPQKEYATVSGKIDTLLVSDNQAVAAHVPLVVMENSANYKDVFLLKSILDTLGFNHHFKFPREQIPLLFLGEVATDFALFENSYDQYRLNKQLQPFSNAAKVNNNALAGLKNRLANLKAQQVLSTEELAFKKKELTRHQNLFEEGLIAAQEYADKQLEILQAERNYRDRNLAISETKEAINNAQLSSESTSINQTIEEKKLLRDVIQSFNLLKRAIKEWELKYVLKSSIAGKVSFLNFWTEKPTINAGDLIFTIVPKQNTGYLARLKTPSFNSGKIKYGQTVNIKVNNYPETEFGTLKGQVKKISLLTDKEGLYIVEVALPSPLLTSYQKEIAFQQEMEGAAEIITEDLRLMERFFYQLKGIFQN